jgi:DNA-binding IclR family transcriptional regulator
MADDPPVPTVLRHAFSILTSVGEAGPSGADAQDVAHHTGLNIRTVYRHLAALRALGMIGATGGEDRRYRLGPAIAALAQNASDQREFLRRARLVAEELGERTQEFVHVTVFDQGTAVTVATASRKATLAEMSPPIVLGSRRPAHASASGKIFLAANPSAFQAYSMRPLERFTPQTIVDVEALEKECLTIREQGWSEDRQEIIPGVTCIAVPVYGVKGRAVGALVISMKAPVLSTARRRALLQVLLPAAAEFTAAIGGVAP